MGKGGGGAEKGGMRDVLPERLKFESGHRRLETWRQSNGRKQFA